MLIIIITRHSTSWNFVEENTDTTRTGYFNAIEVLLMAFTVFRVRVKLLPLTDDTVWGFLPA